MVMTDTLSRVLPDSHFDTMEEAIEEVHRRKLSPPAREAITQIAESPLGGYVVHSVFTEAFLGEEAQRQTAFA